MRIQTAAALLILFAMPALAAENPWIISNANVKTECSACHMAYQAPFLPMRSWQAIVSDLPNHFGEDASITDQAVLKDITGYMLANAGDANGRTNNWIKRIKASDTPLRITETPGWLRVHGEISAKYLKRIGSKSNCVGCHQGAAQGNFGDD